MEYLCVAGMHAKARQSYLTLCEPMDFYPPGFSVHGILQARILEWVSTLSSKELSQPRNQTQVSYTAGRFFSNWATKEIFTPDIAFKWRS